ncbi:MAG: cation:proton antiporter [Chlamydiota bacterium]|nr:cation:proton antiporter [Chlamydiota bacterium]
METDSHTTALTLLIVLGIASKWLSTLLRIPSILLLLIVGILIGPVFGIINPEKLLGNLLVPITSLSVAIILFEGGMSLRFRQIHQVKHIVNNIVTLGAFAGFIATYLFMYYLLGFSNTFSLLQSAILVITGPTVVTPMLNDLHVKPRIRAILKWEGIIIDPIGAIAAVIIFEGLLASPEHGPFEVVFQGFAFSFISGILIGGAGAAIIYYSIKKFWIPANLHSPVTLMMLFLVLATSNYFQADSGLISVTLMGLILGNQRKVKIAHITDFKENLSLILISFLFITLAGIIDSQLLIDTAKYNICIVLFLIFIARPLTVLFSGAFQTLEKKEALFMCCIAPRGIVTAVIASLFGLELSKVGYAQAELFAPITFGVIVGTVTFYSIFTPLAARFLNVSASTDRKVLIVGANSLARAIGWALQKEDFEVQLIEPNFWKFAESKKSSIPVYRGTFLAYENEYQEEIGNNDLLLAMTENDDVNSLAVIHLRSHFDESQLFQLGTKTEKIQKAHMGRHIFSKDCSSERLLGLIDEGYHIKATNLSQEFGFEEWLNKHGDTVILLFHIRKNGELIPNTEEVPLTPKNSGKIIYLTKEVSPVKG